MKFVELSIDQYYQYALENPHYSFLQSKGMYRSQKLRQVDTYCLGVVNQHNQILIATLMFTARTKKFFKLAFADYGFLMNQPNPEAFRFFVDALKPFLKKRRVIKLIVSPYVIKYSETQNQLDVSDLETLYLQNGFHQQARQVNVDRLINLMFIKELDTQENLLKSFEPNLRRSIQKALDSDLIIEKLDRSKLSQYIEMQNENAKKNDIPARNDDYYYSMFDGFQDLNELEFWMASIDIDRYRNNLMSKNKAFEKDILAIQAQGNLSKKKLNQIKSIEEIMAGNTRKLNDVKDITESGILPLASMMVLKNKHEMIILQAAQVDEFSNLNGLSALYYHLMKQAQEQEITQFNFYGTYDVDVPDSKGYKIYEYKKKFGGHLFELVEPFELVINKLLNF